MRSALFNQAVMERLVRRVLVRPNRLVVLELREVPL
jgi:hypothetical protein